MSKCTACKIAIESEDNCFEICPKCGRAVVSDNFIMERFSRFEQFQSLTRRLAGLFLLAE